MFSCVYICSMIKHCVYILWCVCVAFEIEVLLLAYAVIIANLINLNGMSSTEIFKTSGWAATPVYELEFLLCARIEQCA